jgi:hypothetical protein
VFSNRMGSLIFVASHIASVMRFRDALPRVIKFRSS